MKIAIELDGAVHAIDNVAEHDKARTSYLERQGIDVLRIENEMIVRDPDTVIDCIQWAINRHK